MELIAIVKRHDLPLTRPEYNLVTRLDAGMSALSKDRYDRQMKALAAVRETLKQLPDKQTSERQRRMEKAAILKERLKMLRQMIPFISPSAAKSLKAEMKQIAAQIASLNDGGGGSSGSMAATEATVAEAPVSGNDVPDTSDTAQPDAKDQGDGGTQQKQHAASDIGLQEQGLKNIGSTSEDRQLKETIEELKSMYKSVLAALKRRLPSKHGNSAISGLSPHLRIYSTLNTIHRFAVKV